MAQVITVSIARTPDGKDFPLPSYESRYHMGLALKAALPTAVRLDSGDRVFVPVGFAIGVPDGYCGFVVSYPELADKQGIVVLDAPKLISPADRKPLFLLLQNMSSRQVILHRGEIIGLLVVQPVVQVSWKDFSNSELTSGGVTEPVLESGAVSFKTENKMSSSRRVYKSPRDRFLKDEEEE